MLFAMYQSKFVVFVLIYKYNKYVVARDESESATQRIVIVISQRNRAVSVTVSGKELEGASSSRDPHIANRPGGPSSASPICLV